MAVIFKTFYIHIIFYCLKRILKKKNIKFNNSVRRNKDLKNNLIIPK